MENLEMFLGMFILAFSLVCLLTGAFTAYFGVGKSRVIGFIILAIGIVVIASLYFMVYGADESNWWHIGSTDFWTAFAGTLGAVLSMGAALALVLLVMKIIKDKEEEFDMSDLESSLPEIEKEIAKSDEEPGKEKEQETVPEDDRIPTAGGPGETDSTEEPPEADMAGESGETDSTEEPPETDMAGESGETDSTEEEKEEA